MVKLMKTILESSLRHSVIPGGRQIEEHHRCPKDTVGDYGVRAPALHRTDDENRRRYHGTGCARVAVAFARGDSQPRDAEQDAPAPEPVTAPAPAVEPPFGE